MTQAATRIPLDEAEPTTRAMTTDVARRRKGRVGQERINWSTTILLATQWIFARPVARTKSSSTWPMRLSTQRLQNKNCKTSYYLTGTFG